MADYTTLKVEVNDRVALVTLSRPDAANGLDLTMASELASVAKFCDCNDNISAVILTGEGKFFSAGGDIKAMASFGDDVSLKIKLLADDLHAALSTFARMSAPVIVAVNGMAAGAGFSLAISGDIVLADPKAKFVMAYTRAGLSPDGGSSYVLPRLIGLRRTQELMLLNRQLSAAEAYDWGLVTQVMAEGALLDTAKKIAAELAFGPPEANAAVKRLLLESFNNGFEAQMELEARTIAHCAGSDHGREGIAAFIEKRRPDFS